MRLFDGHLDMALNALEWERDQARAVAEIRGREADGVHDDRGICTVTVPELRAGNTAVVLSTVIARAKPWVDPCRKNIFDNDWPAQSMAYGIAMGQFAYYRLLETQGKLTILTTARQLTDHLAAWAADADATPVGMIVTMEGADPILDPGQLQHWHDAGVRTLMLAHFGKSHYAHGTPIDRPDRPHDIDGPLTDMGRALLPEMERLGMPLDLTHTSDQTFTEAVDCFGGQIYSSHTCCRALCDLPRNHTDKQLLTIIERGGVIGLPLFNYFLMAGYKEKGGKQQANLATLANHIDHICQLAGSAKQVAIGSDSDGGFGAEHMPAEIGTHRDIHKLAGTLAGRGYPDDDVALILGGNWEHFFAQTLP